MWHKHRNLSYLFASTFKKLIKNINGFFGIKPSSKSQPLLQVYIHERTFVYQRKCWKMPFLSKNCGSFSQELCGQGILSFRTRWWTFPSLKNSLNDFFSFPLVLHKLPSTISEIVICMARFSLRLSHDTQHGTKSQSLSNPLERAWVRGRNCRLERKEID